jgi:hypothetical protein
MQLVEYIRRKLQGYSDARALDCAREYRAADTAVGMISLGLILVILAHALVEFIDNF